MFVTFCLLIFFIFFFSFIFYFLIQCLASLWLNFSSVVVSEIQTILSIDYSQTSISQKIYILSLGQGYINAKIKQEGRMALDCSPWGSDYAMAWEMSIKGGHFVWLPLRNFKVENLQNSSRERPCEAAAGKEDLVNQQQGKTIWSSSRERRPCEPVAGKENHVNQQQGKKTLWTSSRERRPCEPAPGKEDHVNQQQGKKTLWTSSR